MVWRVEWHTYDIRLDLPPHNRILAGTVPSRVHTDPTSLVSPTLTTFVASKNIRFEKDFQELVPRLHTHRNILGGITYFFVQKEPMYAYEYYKYIYNAY